jgi:hypothetical protein
VCVSLCVLEFGKLSGSGANFLSKILQSHSLIVKKFSCTLLTLRFFASRRSANRRFGEMRRTPCDSPAAMLHPPPPLIDPCCCCCCCCCCHSLIPTRCGQEVTRISSQKSSEQKIVNSVNCSLQSNCRHSQCIASIAGASS